MVVLIIYDIHFIVTEVFLIFILDFNLSSLQHYYIFIVLLFYHFFLDFVLHHLLL